MSHPAPTNPFEANLRFQAELRQRSRYFDSRIERWCEHSGQDIELTRLALESGYTVRFYDRRRGHQILLHTVRPEEVK